MRIRKKEIDELDNQDQEHKQKIEAMQAEIEALKAEKLRQEAEQQQREKQELLEREQEEKRAAEIREQEEKKNRFPFKVVVPPELFSGAPAVVAASRVAAAAVNDAAVGATTTSSSSSSTKLNNVLVFVPSNSSWRPALQEEMQQLKQTHVSFVRPTFAAAASEFSPVVAARPALSFFPAIPLEMYPQNQQVSVLAEVDSNIMKQYWVPKDFGLPQEIKNKMFVGASDENVSRSASNTNTAPMQSGVPMQSTSQPPIWARKKIVKDDSEEEEEEERPKMKMVKKAAKKRAIGDSEDW